MTLASIPLRSRPARITMLGRHRGVHIMTVAVQQVRYRQRLATAALTALQAARQQPASSSCSPRRDAHSGDIQPLRSDGAAACRSDFRHQPSASEPSCRSWAIPTRMLIARCEPSSSRPSGVQLSGCPTGLSERVRVAGWRAWPKCIVARCFRSPCGR